jgi:predicted transglutaminase-like cysteine proteinase
MKLMISPLIAAVLCAVIALAAPSVARADAAALDTVFPGFKALGSTKWDVKTGAVVQWKAMLDRFKDEQGRCEPADGCGKFKALVESLGGHTLPEQIKLVKQAEKPIVYAEDMKATGKADLWATPFETLSTNTGDTEDYAILAYFALRGAGVPAESMRVMAVRLTSQGGVGHALLVVDTTPEPLIVDNRTTMALPASLVGKEFKPALGVNESGWWIYRAAQ